MSDAKVLTEAKRRIDEAETALLSLDEAQGVYSPAVRAGVVAELREALEVYYSLISGETYQQAANQFQTTHHPMRASTGIVD
jgi:hypothetical protein